MLGAETHSVGWDWHVLMHKHRHTGVFLFFGFVLAHVKDFLQN